MPPTVRSSLPDEARTPSEALATAIVRCTCSTERPPSAARRSRRRASSTVQHERSPTLGPHVSEVAAHRGGRRADNAPQASPPRSAARPPTARHREISNPRRHPQKAGPLSDAEWQLITSTPWLASASSRRHPALGNVARFVRASHDASTGPGTRRSSSAVRRNPRSKAPRRPNAADAFCAMTQTRPYRKAMSTSRTALPGAAGATQGTQPTRTPVRHCLITATCCAEGCTEKSRDTRATTSRSRLEH